MKVLFTILLSASITWAQAAAESPVDSSSAKNPGRALLYSFAPGGGQWYNERPVKALLFGGVFVYFGIEYISAQNDYNNDPTNSDLHRTRNDKVWLMALTWTLNIIDAYVDAQLWDFENYPIDSENIPDQEILKPEKVEEINEDE